MPPPSSPTDNYNNQFPADEEAPAPPGISLPSIAHSPLPPPPPITLYEAYPQVPSDGGNPTISSLHRLNLLLRYYLRNRMLLNMSPPPATSDHHSRDHSRDQSNLRQTRLIMEFNRNNNLYLDFQRRSRHRRLRQQRQQQRRRLFEPNSTNIGALIDSRLNQDDTDFCEEETNDENENSDASASYVQGDDENESDNTSGNSVSITSEDSLNNLDSIVSPGFMSIDEDLDNDYNHTNDISTDVPMSSTSSSSVSDENINDQLQNSFPITLQSLRSDISTNERLLLSSARQNPNNRNTLVPSHPLPLPMEAIPLRRQNAIRMRNRNPGQSLESDSLLLGRKDDRRSTNLLHYLTTQEIQNLRNDHLNSIVRLIKSFEGMPNFPGRSPIFKNHSSRHNVNNETIAKLLNLNNSSVLGLNDQLDSFLYQRKSKFIWNDEWNKEVLRSVTSPPKLKSDKQLRLLENYRQVSSTVKEKFKKNAKGRKRRGSHSECDKTSHKRKKMAPSNLTSDSYSPKARKLPAASCSCQNYGDQIDSSKLTAEQKHNIMNILPSSYLRLGSSFQFLSEQSSTHKEEVGLMDININNVDYQLRDLFGSFTVFDKGKDQLMLNKFVNFFAGFKDNKNIPRDKSIFYKLQFLKFLDQDLEKSGFNSKEDTLKFTFPFEGALIDFKNNDLRFFPQSPKDRNSSFHLSSSPSSSHYHESKVKSQEVRFQLLQWFNVEPFNQCTVMFFFNHLLCIARFLKNFGRLSIKVKEQNFAFFDDLRSNINYLTNQFHFLKNLKPNENPITKFTENSIPSVINSGSDSRFVLDWEKRLSDKFADFLTCNEHCLLNVQLNFILFTIKFNLSDFLTEYLKYRLSLLPPDLHGKYTELFKKFTKKDAINNHSKFNCTLLCSLNRKTGSVQIFNPLSSISFANRYYHYLSSCSGMQFESRDSDRLRRRNVSLAAELAAGYGVDYTMMLGAFNDIDDFDGDSDEEYTHDGSNDGDINELTDESFLKLFKVDDGEYELLDPMYVNPATDSEIPQLIYGQARRQGVNQLSYGGGSGTFSFV